MDFSEEGNEESYLNGLKDAIAKLYQEILLRPPDKDGLENFLSLLRNKTITLEEVRTILMESEEGKNIRSFSHYSSEYWNDLEEVQIYLNKLSTGNGKTTWIDHIIKKFRRFLPFSEVLIVGCGNGWLERLLFDRGIATHIDAFDISEKYLEEARKKRGDRSIDYFVSDVNNMENIKNVKYDAVFNYAILHHANEIEYAIKKLAQVLKPSGLIFNWEYVGPSQNQYSDEHVKIMNEVMSKLPERFRTKHPLRPPLENFRVEPTEAIHSDLIRALFKKYFAITYEKDLNGGVAYQILWNNIRQFKDKSDKEASKYLKFILEEDLRLSKNKGVPILFWYCIGKPRNS